MLSQLAIVCGCLEWLSQLIWASTAMCPSSVRRPSTGYGSFDEFANHLTMNRQPYWFTPLLRPGSTIAICCWPGAPKSVTDKLQQVWNAAARVVNGTKKYDHCLTHLLHSELHWLDVADRVTYKLGLTVYKCLHYQAPDYLSELCTPVAQVAERQHLRSAIYSLFHGFSSIRTAVAPSLSLDQRHGTCSKAICVSRTCKLTVFVVHWRRVFLISTRQIERIRSVLRRCAILDYITLH